MNVLMVGVSSKRVGGMWSVADTYINNYQYNEKVNLTYVATSTNGSIIVRVLYMLLGYLKILYYLTFTKVDIVHVHMAEKGSTFRKGKVCKWASKYGYKVIIHLHAGPFMRFYNTLSSQEAKKVNKIFSYADKVCVLGHYWEKELKMIVPEEKIVVLYNGCNVPNVNLYNPGSKNIIYMGVMTQEKGIFDLLKAIKMIDDKLNDVKVLLCGNDLTNEVLKLIKELKLEKRVFMLGWLDANQKKELLKDALISVLPSYYEGLSMTMIESMAYGIPCVTTNISTMNELFNNIVDLNMPGDIDGLANTILDLVNNNSERLKISALEYERAKSLFNTSKFINNTIDIYNRVLIGE